MEPTNAQEAVVALQHIINRTAESDVIFIAANAIAEIATEAALNNIIVDPLLGSDFAPEWDEPTTTEPTTSIRLSEPEIATILHALRKLQDPANCNHVCDHFIDIEPLSKAEIDELCDRLNFTEAN